MTSITTSTGTAVRATPLWRTGVFVGVAAALSTTTVAAVARGAGVPLEIDGAPIPLGGFAVLTLACVAIGTVLAKALSRWATTPRRTFIAVTIALTALSFVPDLFAQASTATKAILMATHVVAAAIVIPAVAGRLPARAR
jgi:hypothetical protein